MATKVFLSTGNLQLISDERDIALPRKQMLEVIDWCKENDINIESPLTLSTDQLTARIFNVNIWRVRDESQRMLFVLRWGHGL
jgi:hypothetical protein